MKDISIVEFIAPFMANGRIVEIFAICANGDRQPKYRGWFTSADAVQEEIERLYEWEKEMHYRVYAAYFVANPCKPDCLYAAVPNRLHKMKPGDVATGNDDILRREWVLVDIDVIRHPSKISSTDSEHEAALQRGLEISDWLVSHGFPKPIRVDSGNGCQLHVAVDLPVDDGGICRQFVETLSCMFPNDSKLQIDTCTHKAAQLCKMPNTWAKKGINSVERPWRMTKALNAPVIASREPLEVENV